MTAKEEEILMNSSQTLSMKKINNIGFISNCLLQPFPRQLLTVVDLKV